MIRLGSAITVSLKADYTAESVKTATVKCSAHFGQVMTNGRVNNFISCLLSYLVGILYGGLRFMSEHNQLNWTDFLLCIASELAYYKRGERPIEEQMIAEKIISLGGKL